LRGVKPSGMNARGCPGYGGGAPYFIKSSNRRFIEAPPSSKHQVARGAFRTPAGSACESRFPLFHQWEQESLVAGATQSGTAFAIDPPMRSVARPAPLHSFGSLDKEIPS